MIPLLAGYSSHGFKFGCADCNWTGTIVIRGDALKISYPCECRDQQMKQSLPQYDGGNK